MKFAAKKTAPEKSLSWDHEGEADSLALFAQEFALLEQLPVAQEFVILEKDTDQPVLSFFRVTDTQPLKLESIDANTVSTQTATPIEQSESVSEAQTQTQTPVVFDLGPYKSMAFFMAKVFIFSILAVVILAIPILWVRGELF